MPEPTQTAEPVADERTGTEILKALTPAQTKKWRETGELPAVKAQEEKPAEAPAEKPAEAPPEKPAEAPKPAEEPQPDVKALEAENKRLAAELETLRKSPASVSAPKGDEPPKPKRHDLDSKTGLPLYATDEAFEEARDKWVFEKASRETRTTIAKEQAEAKAAEQNKIIERRLQNSLEIAQKKHKDFADVLKLETKDGKTVFNADAVKAIKNNGVLDAWILDSEVGAEILYHLCKNPDEVQRIQALGPFAAARELTKMELQLSESSAPAKPEEKPAAPVKVPPSPAASIGGKATGPVDEEAAAVEAGDFSRYKKAADAEEHRKRTVN